MNALRWGKLKRNMSNIYGQKIEVNVFNLYTLSPISVSLILPPNTTTSRSVLENAFAPIRSVAAGILMESILSRRSNALTQK